MSTFPFLVNCSKSDADAELYYSDLYLHNKTPYNLKYHVEKRSCSDEDGTVDAGETATFGVGWCEIQV